MILQPIATLLWLTAALGSLAPAAVSGEPKAVNEHRAARPSNTPAADCGSTSYDCAISLIERHDYEAAIDTLQAMLARAPRDLKALNLLGIALTGAGRIEDANARFRQALAIDSGFHPARKNLAVNELNKGDLDQARRLFLKVIAGVPDDEVAHLHLGEIEFALDRRAAALRHYEKSGARVMSDPGTMLRYASCLLALEQKVRALTVFDMLPADDAASRFEAGVALGRAGAHIEAARFFGTARSGYKDPYAAGYNQVLMLVEGGDHHAAIRVAEELLPEVETAELFNLVSRAYLAAGRIQEAYDALRAATRLEPSAEHHYIDLALICMDHENYDLGLEIVDIGLRHRPDAAGLHLHRGVLLVMKGLIDQAEPEFDRARRLTPGSSAPYVALAMAWMQSGRTDRAVELLREHAVTSRQAIVPYMLGIALIRSGVDPAGTAGAEAVQAFETAIRLDPTLAGARGELGKILLKRGDVDGAIAHLEAAVQLDPEQAAPAYSLAQAYRRVGKLDRAQQLLARVSSLNAAERGDEPDRELKRMVVRIVREGSTSGGSAPPPR